MAGLETKTGELGHQIKFGGPRIAMRTAEHVSLAAGTEGDVVGREPLGDDLVGVDAEEVGLGAPYEGVVARRETAQLGNRQLDDEASAWLQVSCSVLEARHLF